MSEACMFDILAIPQDRLRRILPKASTRSLAKLVSAYPRAVGRTFLEILEQCASPVTVEFIREETNTTRLPTYPEIRQAELELMKIIHEDQMEDPVVSDPLATALPQ
jgi:hypothetical protein